METELLWSFAGRTRTAGSDASVLITGGLAADPGCTDRRAVEVADSAFSARGVLADPGRAVPHRRLCLPGGMNYHPAAIPEDFMLGADAMVFDRGS